LQHAVFIKKLGSDQCFIQVTVSRRNARRADGLQQFSSLELSEVAREVVFDDGNLIPLAVKLIAEFVNFSI